MIVLASTASAQRDLDDASAMARLRSRALAVPVQSVQPSDLLDTYRQPRDAGARAHEALDIPAPRGTPVLAVGNGRIAKLFASKPGGLTIYQFDPPTEFAYYYAHLDRYADGLKEGASVRRGDIIGYVGSTGNASADVPHLHFAVFRLEPEHRWWRGTPLNPFSIWREPVR
jgi:murein DD-endopeptidase MepM/ murein hydrolase activator NlpD